MLQPEADLTKDWSKFKSNEKDLKRDAKYLAAEKDKFNKPKIN